MEGQQQGRSGADGDHECRCAAPHGHGAGVHQAVQVEEHHMVHPGTDRRRFDDGDVVDGEPGHVHVPRHGHLHEHGQADRRRLREGPRETVGVGARLIGRGRHAAAMDVTLEPLWGHRDLAPLLARWHYEEFGDLYDPRVWNLEIATLEFEAMADPASSDVTWVAFDGDPADTSNVVGSVSLIGSDDLPGFEHLTPWLASLFIAPRARGLGIGSLLVDKVIDEAASRGHDYVHLFTAGQEQYYLDRDWRTIADCDHRGRSAVVMARATSSRGARRAVSSHWCSDPDTAGAYSYLRVGGRPEHRARLGAELLPSLWFAGEATSVEYPATMHGAWFSGERAADAVIAGTEGEVLVVGAGLAGLAAARRLVAAGRDTTVIELRERAGG